ncbi:LPS assembly lipoprotein LptE [Marinobacter sp. 2_MG-2023]|uniref:LPS-assembly lipoprotein LptE n=1 Tax=Marinobacter sp. 2_MG-2023 TaxID=3062679 RepID=UPI0026E3004A|nr:LPS assembly lipoprotein LptE [Marinobacter sp. 2_MG-2023]MDO6443791.1 LPS assembly lipoprotein LptE [Marinobacter sp. 2_MG-2023]
MQLNAARLIAISVMAASLGACGFQLRGASPVSSALEPLHLDCQAPVPTALCVAVRNQLELGGVLLASDEEAKYHLKIRNFEQDRRASAITVQAAAAEYTLRHSVNLEVISGDGIPIIASTRLSTSESYRYDETNVLAKQREEENLQQQLSDRLAQQIIFRLVPLTQERLQEIRNSHNKATTPANDQPPVKP